MKKLLLIVFIFIVFVILIGMLVMNYYIEPKLEDVANLEIKDIDIAKVEDGIYSGGFNAIIVQAEVKVFVNNGKIENIVLLKHVNGRGQPAEAIIDDIIEEQSLKVDVISGSTYSSKVILKAIENSLSE